MHVRIPIDTARASLKPGPISPVTPTRDSNRNQCVKIGVLTRAILGNRLKGLPSKSCFGVDGVGITRGASVLCIDVLQFHTCR